MVHFFVFDFWSPNANTSLFLYSHPKYWICILSISHIGLETTFTSILEFTSLIIFLAILSAPKPNALLAKQVFGTKSKKRKMMHCRYSTQCAEIFTFNFLFVSLKSQKRLMANIQTWSSFNQLKGTPVRPTPLLPTKSFDFLKSINKQQEK